MNLTSNAVKFTHEGAVTLQADCLHRDGNKAQIRFAVQDTGIGIDKKHVDKIFESFSQADNSVTRKYGGTGLGTTIALNLVRLMGGELKLESELGKGSRFYFDVELLLSSEEEVQTVMQLDAVGADRDDCKLLTGNILVAEDYEANQEVARCYVDMTSCSLTIAENGLKAVEACEKEVFDLIFLDVQMPVMGGYEAVRTIRSADTPNAKAPIIALTANADAETRQKCLDAGMDAVMTKPIRRTQFMQVLSRHMSSEPSKAVTDETPIEAPPQVEAVVLELPRMIEEFGNNREVALRVLKKYLKKLPGVVAALRKNVDAGELEPVRAQAHQTKGASIQLTAECLSHAAAALEKAAEAGDVDAVMRHMEAVEREAEKLLVTARELAENEPL